MLLSFALCWHLEHLLLGAVILVTYLFNAPLTLCAYNVYLCGSSGGKSESALILTLFY
ncbi:hypothetical protein Hanom_Chr16g01456051 [Helianthus anomalus]